MNSAMSCGGPIGTCCKWLYLLTEAIITAPCQLPTPCQRNTLQHSLCILLLFSQETSEFTDVNSVQDPVPFNLKKKKEKYFTELNSWFICWLKVCRINHDIHFSKQIWCLVCCRLYIACGSSSHGFLTVTHTTRMLFPLSIRLHLTMYLTSMISLPVPPIFSITLSVMKQ